MKGAPIDWARITDPLFADLQAIGILSKGRNTSAARLFMDFVLSKEGQQILAETGRTVLRSDVPMSDGINPEKLQIIGPEARIDPDKYQQFDYQFIHKMMDKKRSCIESQNKILSEDAKGFYRL